MLGRKVINLLSNKVTGQRFFLVTLLLVTLFLTGCVTLPDPETSQEFNKAQVGVVSPNQTIGQTFVSRRARLNGIDLWLGAETSGYTMTVELFHEGDLDTPIHTTTVGTRSGKTHIDFPPQVDPPNQHYYLRLSNASGEIALLGRNEDSYNRGTAFINDQPVDADLAFRVTYDYDAMAVFSDLRGMLAQWYLTLPLGIVLLLPGWLLLDFSEIRARLDFGERMALALGLSLSIIPVLMLWTTLVGLRWGPISVWLGAGILTAVFIWRLFKRSSIHDPQLRLTSTTSKIPISNPSSNIILLAIFGLTLFTRMAMARDLVAPPWVDSIHHSLITRLMIESGGIPETYAPYLPTEANYYHFGFHSGLAVFTWLTGFGIHQGMLIFGQVLNALMVFAVYLLAKTLTNSRPTALTASLVAGVFTLMPAYYLSWGRYTQLAGLLVLPTAFKLFTEITKQAKGSFNRRKYIWLLGSISFAGLFLIHYRVTAFLGGLILAYLLAQINLRGWPKTIGRLLLLGFFTILLLLPWLPGTLAKLLIPKGDLWRGGAVSSFSQIPWNFLKPALGEVALVMAGIGLILGFILLKRFTVTILLWTGSMYLLANMGIFNLPGSGFVNPVSMEITLFMPIAVLAGIAVGGTLELLDKFIPDRWQITPRVVFLFIGVGAAILGARRLIPTLNPITFLAREEDFPALNWMEENLPESDTILINPTRWGYGLFMGNDGGYWISPLTGRQTMPPSALYGLGSQEEINEINQFIEAVLPIGEDATALWELLKLRNIHFVYTGARGGIISPQTLTDSELFSVQYHQNGTWVFKTLEKTP